MITTIINGIMIDAESIVEAHFIECRYKRYEEEKRDFSHETRSRCTDHLHDDDTITQIIREILATNRGK